MSLPAVANAGGVRLIDLSVEDLKKELAQAVEITARHLAYIADVWRELERRGEDMSAFRSGLWTYMPDIAAGRLRAEIVIKYAGYVTLLGQIAQLPLQDQDVLIADDTVILVEHKDGEFIETPKPLRSLKAAETKQVINKRIVPPEDQRRRALGSAAASSGGGTMKERTIKRARRERKMRFDDKVQTVIPMTKGELDALDKAALDAGVPLNRLIRAALVTTGLLDD